MLCLLHLLLPPSSNSFSGAQPRDEARLWGSCCEAGGSKPSFTPSSASVGQGVFPVSRQVPHGVCWESGPMEDPPQCSQDRDLSESPISQQVPQCHLEHRPTGVPSCPRESPQRPQDRNTLRGPSSLSVPRGGRVPSALGSRGQSPLRIPSASPQLGGVPRARNPQRPPEPTPAGGSDPRRGSRLRDRRTPR